MNNVKLVLGAILVGLGIGVWLDRSLTKKPEITKQEETAQTITKIVKGPDGNEVITIVRNETKQTVAPSPIVARRLRLDLGLQLHRDGSKDGGVDINYRVVGPVWIGIGASTNNQGTIAAKLGVEF